ncbi:quinone oxidoreductase family protein [Microvirga thermotolerans]|uniref:Zinc-binding dehydrogenase n=1 Tax=Microvirga thermotolerans TaxID=2651334 RepID=A0A5P9JUY9_9HYPH|nr:quinone oxidoreductase [Microvirga thermotolerans]QFU15598.1 zinc-binding dehydrogenase [Microvirga thermotolerans]
MTRVVRIHDFGGPEALRLDEVDLPSPGPGEVLVRQSFAGVNYVDVYHRTGLYPLPQIPAVLGVEGAGTVEAVGPGVDSIHVGDRVAYTALPVGAYAAARLIPADRLLRLPPAIPERSAAGAMLRGVTAHMLLHRTYPVGPGTTLLVHAAAGGLGLVLVQWARLLGATVIGTVGSEEKAEIARAAGLDHAILYRNADFVSAVREITDGRGVDVAYDGIGGTTLLRTFDAVRPFGTVASVGQAGGPIPPIDVAQLGPRRSLSLSRPSVFGYMTDVATYRTAAAAFLALLEQGRIRASVGAAYPLAEAPEAHRDLEGRRTTGSILLAA